MKKQPVAVPAREKAAELEIMVEGMGHINYGGKMESDRKGIVGDVRLDGKALKNWKVIPKTLSESSVVNAQKSPAQDKACAAGISAARLICRKLPTPSSICRSGAKACFT